MYEVDHKDRVVPLENVPQSSIGAPLPVILADEHRALLAYYTEERSPDWDGKSIRIVGPLTKGEPVALALFEGCAAHMFGSPNDEASSGHPLASRGLRPYGAFKIENSSWIRRLERMNSVHPHHRPERFWESQHLVFAFHDSTFECVCRLFKIELTHGSMANMMPRMVGMLQWESD
jgi:hypothetical protein